MIADYANKVNHITPATTLIASAYIQGTLVCAFLAAVWSPRVVTRVVNNERRPARPVYRHTLSALALV